MPQGVRLVLADGRVVPVDVMYEGVNEGGEHQWKVVTDVKDGVVVSVEVAVFPARTAISFPRPSWLPPVSDR